jgi:hypothetical protein
MSIHYVHVKQDQIWDWGIGRTEALIWLKPVGDKANGRQPFLVNLNENAGFPHPSQTYALIRERRIGTTGTQTPYLVIALFFPAPVPLSAAGISFFIQQEGAEGFEIVGQFE